MVQLHTDDNIAPPHWVALVDDEVQITQAMQMLLSFKGVSSSVHHSAESLLQSLQVRDGQLWLQCADEAHVLLQSVVLDLNLPGNMNGIDLVTELRRLQPQLRMVMITAATEETWAARKTDLLGVTLLSKPFSLESLEAALFES